MHKQLRTSRNSVAKNKARADQHAANLLPVIESIRSVGVTKLVGIASARNARGIATTRGWHWWYASNVRNLFARAGTGGGWAMRWILQVLATALFLSSAAAAQIDDVYYCVDTKGAGIIWDQENQQGEGRVAAFEALRFTMKIVEEMESFQKREIIWSAGDGAGNIDFLFCFARWPHTDQELLTCESETGLEPFAFKGDRYTRAYLYGSPVGTPDDGMVVYHGTCMQF